MLLTRKICRDVRSSTPEGVPLDLEIVQPVIGEGRASCAVRKFSSDDPDATDGLLIFAEAKQVSREDAADACAGYAGIQMRQRSLRRY
ncbi:MAG: cobalt-precorrin-5B (C(1))-methyltransferase [Lachnospiraceae bacterium]